MLYLNIFNKKRRSSGVVHGGDIRYYHITHDTGSGN